jgi:hypothetical protein
MFTPTLTRSHIVSDIAVARFTSQHREAERSPREKKVCATDDLTSSYVVCYSTNTQLEAL